MARIRALVLHVVNEGDLKHLPKFVELSKVFDPLTIRLSVAVQLDFKRVVKEAEEQSVGYIAGLHFRDAKTALEYVEDYGIFITLIDVEQYIEFLRTVERRGEPEMAKYVCLILNGLVFNSPYFPISITTKRGVSVSLVYPNDVKTLEDINHVLKKAESLGVYIANSLGLEFLGVDASLSPWGTESVAELIRRIFGVRVGEWGTYEAIKALNSFLNAAEVKKTGFNEVMLPLAEDEALKKLVEEGVLTLDKLTFYTSTCVAGLDMVPLDIENWDKFRKFLRDLATISLVKSKPIGVRVFPVHGEYYEVDHFGRTPVLKLY